MGYLFGVLIGVPAPARVAGRTKFASPRFGRIIILPEAREYKMEGLPRRK